MPMTRAAVLIVAAALTAGRGDANVHLTEGTKQGAAIAGFEVFAYDSARIAAWRAAFAEVTRKCATYTTKDKTYVTTSALTGLPAVEGADEVLGRMERVYADAARTTLYYVRPTLFARFGRVIVAVQYAYVQPKTDPVGKDLTTVGALMTRQAAKVRTTFGV